MRKILSEASHSSIDCPIGHEWDTDPTVGSWCRFATRNQPDLARGVANRPEVGGKDWIEALRRACDCDSTFSVVKGEGFDVSPRLIAGSIRLGG